MPKVSENNNNNNNNNNNKPHISIFGFQCVAKNIERSLMFCTSDMVYSQIWLYIFLVMIITFSSTSAHTRLVTEYALPDRYLNGIGIWYKTGTRLVIPLRAYYYVKFGLREPDFV